MVGAHRTNAKTSESLEYDILHDMTTYDIRVPACSVRPIVEATILLEPLMVPVTINYAGPSSHHIFSLDRIQLTDVELWKTDDVSRSRVNLDRSEVTADDRGECRITQSSIADTYRAISI